MKKLLVAAAVVVALASAPIAAADGMDDAFIHVLHEQGINHAAGDWAMIQAGHEVCDQLYSGDTIMAVINDVHGMSDLSTAQSGYFVGASVAAYCPEFVDQILPTAAPPRLIYAT